MNIISLKLSAVSRRAGNKLRNFKWTVACNAKARRAKHPFSSGRHWSWKLSPTDYLPVTNTHSRPKPRPDTWNE